MRVSERHIARGNTDRPDVGCCHWYVVIGQRRTADSGEMIDRYCEPFVDPEVVGKFFKAAAFALLGSLSIGDMQKSQLLIFRARNSRGDAGIHPARNKANR